MEVIFECLPGWLNLTVASLGVLWLVYNLRRISQ